MSSEKRLIALNIFESEVPPLKSSLPSNALFEKCRWRWKKGPKQRWSGYFSLCPFPSWKGVFSQNGPQRSRARRCCAAKRTLHGEDRSEILDKRERGGPKWTAKMAQSLTASDTNVQAYLQNPILESCSFGLSPKTSQRLLLF